MWTRVDNERGNVYVFHASSELSPTANRVFVVFGRVLKEK